MEQYLTFVNPKAGSLKGNQNLHKSGTPFRTFISGINTPTKKLAEVAEDELQEYALGSQSYIRDTTYFINKLKEIDEPIPEIALLFCFDVCKLYPSIPKEEGIAACWEALETRTTPLIPTEYLLEMITCGNGMKNSLSMIGLCFTKGTLMMGLGPCNLCNNAQITFIAAYRLSFVTVNKR